MALTETCSSLEAYQAELDAEIQTLETRIISLRYRRNSLSRVNRIPSEILLEVFACLRALHEDEFRENYERKDRRQHQRTLGWIRVAHVSKVWRETAVGASALWASIPFANDFWVQTCLSRARSAPLSVVCALRVDTWPLLQPALIDPSAVRELRVSAIGNLFPQVAAQFSETLRGFAVVPSLESLELTGSYDEPLTIPEEAFSQSTPLLRSVALYETSFDWQAAHSFLRNLTSLTIDLPSRRTRADQFLDLLRSMPDLAELDLSGVLETNFDDESANKRGHAIQAVRLLKLRQIRFCEELRPLAFLIAHVKLPSPKSGSGTRLLEYTACPLKAHLAGAFDRAGVNIRTDFTVEMECKYSSIRICFNGWYMLEGGAGKCKVQIDALALSSKAMK